MKTRSYFRLAAVFGASMSSPCHAADPLVYQGFEGYAAGPLPAQTIGAQTRGFDPAGTITSAGTGANSNVFDPTGLAFSNLLTSGGSGLYGDSAGRASYIGFAYNRPTVSGTLYTSYLVKLVTAQNTVSVVSLRANVTATTGGTGSYFHTYADSVSSTFTGSQYDANNLNTASATTLATGTTFVVLGRFTRVGSALSAGSTGLATTFVLSAEQFDFFKTDGFTDAELDAASIGTGVTNVTSRVSDAPVNSGTFNFAAGNAVQFGPGNAAVNQIIAYDELRFGLALDDVLPLFPVQEPDPVDVTLAVSAATAQEPTTAGDAIGSITLTRAGDTTAGLLINLSVSGNASNGLDFPEVPPAVLIPAGASSLVIPLPALTDSLIEEDETVLVENFTGLEPLVADRGAIAAATVVVGDSSHIALTYPRAPGTGLSGIPEISTDLQTWHSGVTWLAISADATPDLPQNVIARSLATMNAAGREFLRLRVTP